MYRISLFVDTWEQLREAAIATAIKPLKEHITAAIEPLAACARELDPNDEDTVVYRSEHRVTKLFELGEFGRYSLSRGTGHTSLFIGEDGNFYEYGPHYRGQSEEEWWPSIAPGVKVTFKITPITLESMDYLDILLCHELMARPWIT